MSTERFPASRPPLPAHANVQEQEIDRLLQGKPRDIQLLVAKGDLRVGAGDERAASAFYKAALRAAAAEGRLPVSLSPYIARAQAALADMSRDFELYLENKLAQSGFPSGKRPPRFQESLEILAGYRQPVSTLQKPGGYFFPGLPQRRYYERAEFEWVARVEAASGVMREELLGLVESSSDRFTPYMVNDPTRPQHDFHGMVDNPDWSTLYLWQNGAPVREHVACCPQTFDTIMRLDLPHITKRAPSILFSRLSPGARIPPHTGVLNTRLICHLPLVVPAGCGFKVGGEAREWKEGELLMFDDTVEHEAWNDSTSDRIILIFDVWKPELSVDERAAVTALFEAVDSYDS